MSERAIPPGVLAVSAILLCAGLGCSVTQGHFVPSSQFAYPNSNIKSLGPVRAEVSKSSWLVVPQLKLKDVKECYQKALSQASGANIIINYKEDTTYTEIPILAIITVKYVIDGEAAQMTVGQQELK